MNLALTSHFPSFRGLGLFRRRAPARRPVWVTPSADGAADLDKGSFLAVPRTSTVTCLRGCLWITHDSDATDIVISAGESYTSRKSGRMLVFALHASSATVA